MNADFETLFLQVRELPTPEERAAFLDEACAGDADLRQRLEEMLVNADEAVEFFGDAVTRLASRGPMIEMSEEKTGGMVGAYKLLQQIGEGGFGTVWMADQLRPVRRRVALKVIKPGLDTKEIIARFEQERQALALMDHPNIARVFDAGATESGRPYFVMELVRGTRITDYCDENGLRISERIHLFIQVCQAVHHAHQKGIIHRDIKPSNVLVTINDGEPVVKVIDFGVAKATQGSLTDATLFTQFHQMIGTPAYMSPEQAEMTSQDIDTRSDVYSLGVLLYELITGRTPLDVRSIAKAGLDEMRRLIREETPPRPSARVKTLSAEELTTTAKRRRTESGKLTTTLRGDLDWIAMMCLEKDRKRRYDSAHALAIDLQRYLAHGIVTARPPTAAYLLGRIMRRHRGVFLSAAAVVVALVAGLGIALWQYFEKSHAYQRVVVAEQEQSRLKDQALTEAVHSREVATLLQDMIGSVSPAMARGRDTTLLRELMERTEKRLSDKLHDQPAVEAELRSTLGKVYDVLGDYPQAVAMHRAALVLRQKAYGSPHAKVLNSLNALGWALGEQGHKVEAEKMIRDALAMSTALNGREHQETARALSSLSFLLQGLNRNEEGEKYAEEAVAQLTKELGPEHGETGKAMLNQGIAQVHLNKFSEAEETLQKALKIISLNFEEDHPVTGTALANLGLALSQGGKPREAEPFLRRAVAVDSKIYAADHPYIASSQEYLAQTLTDLGKLEEAESWFRKVLATKELIYGKKSSEVADTLHNLGKVIGRAGNLKEATELMRRSLGYKEAKDPDSLDVANVLDGLGALLSVQRENADAEKAFERGLKIRMKLRPGSIELAESYQNLGTVLAQQDKTGAAIDYYRKALEIRRKLPGFLHPSTAKVLQQLAFLLLLADKPAEAEEPAAECKKIQEKFMPGQWKTYYAGALLGASLLGQKKYPDAERHLTEALEGMMQKEIRVPQGGDQQLKETMADLEKLYTETNRSEKASEWRKKRKE